MVKYTIVTAVKDRALPLRYTIPSWLQRPEVEGVILVDWASKKTLITSLQEMNMSEFPDDRVRIVEVQGEKYWRPGAAFNFAISLLPDSSTFLKLDADVCVLDELPELDPCTYKYKPGDHKRNRNEESLHGSFMCRKVDFDKTGGYSADMDERYGFEDCDLYARLVGMGVEATHFDYNLLYHLHHSDRERVANYENSENDLNNAIKVMLTRAYAKGRVADLKAPTYNIVNVAKNYDRALRITN